MTCKTAVRGANEGVLFPGGCVRQRLSLQQWQQLNFTSCTGNLARAPVFCCARVVWLSEAPSLSSQFPELLHPSLQRLLLMEESL